MNRNERQRQLNMKLGILPIFTPLTDCQIYSINRTTSSLLIHDLIQIARQTTRFTIDTEHDYRTHEPALIQIEFIQKNSIVLLIETSHLPHQTSLLFWLIQSLFKMIFKSSSVIYAWGDLHFELTDFIPYGLFSSNTIDQLNIFNVQLRFEAWYNKTFVHQCDLQSLDDDHQSCTCLYRPVKHKNNLWSLQKAIAYTYDEFLNKNRTKSNWSRCLNLRKVEQYSILINKIKKSHEHLILYAVNDCLAVTKLLMIIECNWTQQELQQYNQNKQQE